MTIRELTSALYDLERAHADVLNRDVTVDDNWHVVLRSQINSLLDRLHNERLAA